MKRLTTILFICCLGSSMGCDEPSNRCVTSGDCPLPQVCLPLEVDDFGVIVRGVCGIECRVDSDCASDDLCIEAVCQSPSRPCRVMEDCEPFGRVCIEGIRRCVQRCAPTLPCPNGTYCESGYCLPEGVDATLVSGEPLDAQLRRDGTVTEPDIEVPIPGTPDMGSTDLLVPTEMTDGGLTDQSMPPRDIFLPMRGSYGSPCNRASDCTSDLCLPNIYSRGGNSVGICSQSCLSSADCPSHDSCIEIQNASGGLTSVCAPNESGQDCSGNTAGVQCPYHRICNAPPAPFPQEVPALSQCAANCNTSDDCPSGYRCDRVSVNGMNQFICTPDVNINLCQGSNEFCGGVCPNTVPSTEADVAHCVGYGGDARLCTCECDSASDCPQGFACDAISPLPFALTSGRAGMCFPISGYRCDGTPQNCMSALCTIAPTDLTRPVCTAPCRTTSDCPTNYHCEVDSRLGVAVCRPND